MPSNTTAGRNDQDELEYIEDVEDGVEDVEDGGGEDEDDGDAVAEYEHVRNEIQREKWVCFSQCFHSYILHGRYRHHESIITKEMMTKLAIFESCSLRQ